jgi:hypothetical protein
VNAAQQYRTPLAQREELIRNWVEPNPYKPGLADVRIRSYGVPVWALIGHALATGSSAAELAVAYELPQGAAEAALAYYECHREAIDMRLAANAA